MRLWRAMAEEHDAQPRASIVLRAPDGEVGWTLVELQGTVEPRSGTLDGMKFARLVRGEVGVRHSLVTPAVPLCFPWCPQSSLSAVC